MGSDALKTAIDSSITMDVDTEVVLRLGRPLVVLRVVARDGKFISYVDLWCDSDSETIDKAKVTVINEIHRLRKEHDNRPTPQPIQLAQEND